MLEQMNRLCVFAHFDRDNVIDGYVLNYLKALRSVAHSIVFVSTSQLTGPDIRTLSGLCDSVITRANVGHDFMSWRIGLASVSDLAAYDEVIVCNDSVYGPFYPLEQVFHKMAKRDCDFWGITCGTHKSFHLQSYFIVFRRRILASRAFNEFWQSVTPERSKERVVEKYEIGLTDRLVKEGFRPAAYTKHSPSFLRYLLTIGPPWSLHKCLWLFIVAPLSGVVPRWKQMAPPPRNSFSAIYVDWKQLILRRKAPFLKIDLLRSNPTGADIDNYKQFLQKCCDFDVSLIENHLRRMKAGNGGNGLHAHETTVASSHSAGMTGTCGAVREPGRIASATRR
jgi:lipopolysaccharide biosynthesis protein